MSSPPSDDLPPVFSVASRDRLQALLRWRRDVRHFRPDPIPPAILEDLLAVAALAPSVGLSQPARFVTVDTADRRAAIRANFSACNAEALASHGDRHAPLYARLKLAGLDTAPCHIAAFAEPAPAQGHGLGRRTMPQTTAYSAVLAVHTLWLAARAQGIGLGWVSILDPAAVTAALDIPAEWIFIGYLCLGYPRAESLVPELEEAGWETRRPGAVVLRR